jgi:hypothetical protein
MKQIITILLILITSGLFAQTSPGKITRHSNFWGYYYKIDGTKVKTPIVESNLKTYDKAYNYYKKGQSNLLASSILGAAGGVLIGWPLGTWIAGGNPNWTLAYVGLGLTIVSIPIESAFRKNNNKALMLYNEQQFRSNNTQTSLQLRGTSNGIGLVWGFK